MTQSLPDLHLPDRIGARVSDPTRQSEGRRERESESDMTMGRISCAEPHETFTRNVVDHVATAEVLAPR